MTLVHQVRLQQHGFACMDQLPERIPPWRPEMRQVQTRDLEAATHSFIGRIRFRGSVVKNIFRITLRRRKRRETRVLRNLPTPRNNCVFRQPAHAKSRPDVGR